MSTLGLWTSDLGLTIFPRASGAGRPGWRSLTRLTLTLCWTFTRRLTDVGKVKIRDQGNHQDRNNIGPTYATKIMRSGVRVADVMELDILNKIDDIKIGVSYMKTRVRMDSWQTNLWFMLRCYDPLIINSFFMELKIKWNFRNKSSQ